MTCNFTRPISGLGSVEGWKNLPIHECGEPLVPLGSFSEYPMIATDSIYVGERDSSPYPTLKLDGALFTVFVREGVAKRLKHAASLLPSRHMLFVWDAYRPQAVQQALFDSYVDKLVDDGTSREQAQVDAQQFVSVPSDDPTRPPPHNTGGAVDLTIIRFSAEDWERMEHLTQIVMQTETSDNWQAIYRAEMERLQIVRARSMPLLMGTVFDGVQDETFTLYFENLGEADLSNEAAVARDNRRLLWNVMDEAGFSNYPDEWWHFDFGNQFDAARTGREAKYAAAVFSQENQAWETMRRGHYEGSVAMAQGTYRAPPNKLGIPVTSSLIDFVTGVTAQTGNLRHTQHPQAAAF